MFLPIGNTSSQTRGASKLRGIWLGIIVDNKDGGDNPGYRVKVKFPWLNDQETSFWARIAVPMAGPERGTYVLPEIDDQVLVVFEHGDVERPIVIGAMWSKKQEPVEVNDSAKNKKNKIVLDSVNKIIKLESDGDIEIKAKTNIVMHSNALKVGTKEGITGK